jgi:ribosomal protein L11 methyltransferase
VIDPGRAFGTGSHATTRLCLELLLTLRARGSFLDLGCGSGVLAIAAAELGFAPVLAVDNDPAAVQATVQNARVNGAQLQVEAGDLRHGPVPSADTVAANLLGPLLITYAARLDRVPERLIAGGLLVDEIPRVSQAFAARGLGVVDTRSAGDWAALLMHT